MNKQYGYIQDVIRDEDYIFGDASLPQELLQSNGDWSAYLPIDELQIKNGFESMNCTSYGTLNCIETLMLRKFGDAHNYSERYTGIMARTTPEGNSPQTVIETIRKVSGLIDEKLLPFDAAITTWEAYYSPNPMTYQYNYAGRKWLDTYNVGHEWVFTSEIQDKPSVLKEALKYSPLGVSVYAWQLGPDGFYIKIGGDNHWVMMYGYEDGQYWKIFDQYDSTHKKLAWNFDFGSAKRYHIERKSITIPKTITQKVKRVFGCWWNNVFMYT